MSPTNQVNPEIAAFSPRELSAIAARVYADAPPLQRFLATYRPFICPFEWLLQVVPKDARVLDVGCGIGLLGALLVETGVTRHVTGFDSCAPAIRVAQAAAKGLADRHPLRPHGTTIDFQHWGVEAPWPTGPFDAVCVVDVMHHVPTAARRSIIDLAMERLVPGGVLIYKDMVRRPLWRATANRLHDLALARQWIRYEPVENVEAWARARGGELIRVERGNRWWYGHELRVFRRI